MPRQQAALLASEPVAPPPVKVNGVPPGSAPSQSAAAQPPVRGWLAAGQTPPVALESYRPDDWRGVPRERLAWAGRLVVDRAPGVSVHEQSRGRVKVLVDAKAPSQVWVFTPTQDVRLEPGSVVTFQADGQITTRIGRVEEFEPGPSRPLEPGP